MFCLRGGAFSQLRTCDRPINLRLVRILREVWTFWGRREKDVQKCTTLNRIAVSEQTEQTFSCEVILVLYIPKKRICYIGYTKEESTRVFSTKVSKVRKRQILAFQSL